MCELEEYFKGLTKGREFLYCISKNGRCSTTTGKEGLTENMVVGIMKKFIRDNMEDGISPMASRKKLETLMGVAERAVR